jgi:hypothetical protein
MNSESAAQTKEYSIAVNSAFKLKVALIAFAIIPITIAMIGISISSLLIILFGLLMAILEIPILVYLFRRLRVQKLQVSKNGLRFIRVFGRQDLDVPWHSIVKIHIGSDDVGVVTDGPIDNPVIRQLARSNRLQLAKAKENPLAPTVLMAQQRWIPFGTFVDWFWHGDLLRYIRDFAPGLAQECELQIGSHPEVRSGRGRWILALAVFASLSLAIFGSLWVIAQLLTVPGQTVNPLVIIVGRLASLSFGLFLIFLVPTLAYYAVLSGSSALQSLKEHDTGEAFTALVLMLAQAGFALWISISLVSNFRTTRSTAGERPDPNIPAQTIVPVTP